MKCGEKIVKKSESNSKSNVTKNECKSTYKRLPCTCHCFLWNIHSMIYNQFGVWNVSTSLFQTKQKKKKLTRISRVFQITINLLVDFRMKPIKNMLNFVSLLLAGCFCWMKTHKSVTICEILFEIVFAHCYWLLLHKIHINKIKQSQWLKIRS